MSAAPAAGVFSPEHSLPVDADLVLVQLLTGQVDAAVCTELPAQAMADLPRLVAVTYPSAAAPDPLRHLRVGIQLDGWASSRAQASLVCRQGVAVLDAAWTSQRVVDAGHLRRVALSTGPAEVRDDAQPDGVWRFSASLIGIFRPTS